MKLLSAFLYPVKSMRAVTLDSFELDARGIVGDRRWMVVDASDRFVTQRSVPAMVRFQPRILNGGLELDEGGAVLLVATPDVSRALRRRVTIWRDTFEALDAGDEAAQWLSARLGEACRLVCFADDVRRDVDAKWASDAQTGFTDGYPLLIANEASLDALNATLPSPLPMDRFRPNVVVRGAGAWEEDGWSKLSIDGVPFDGVKPCARCVAITTDQQTGARPLGSEPLTRLNELHAMPQLGAIFGMNLVHRSLGRVRVGSDVVIHP